MYKINTLSGNNRMSTQDLLQIINDAIAAGEHEFDIEAYGQHDIGGPLWHAGGKTLKFLLKNPGQRVGSMCLPGTEIIVEGPASADVGWLNAGGKIVVRGDSGDTTAHCAASGSIYIGGRAGSRSGSLMKHDVLYDPPEFWVLKNCGSFSFEFMGGGSAVVCGYDCEQFASVLGDRSCIGMVGGNIYFRGKASGLSAKDVKIGPLDKSDINYLDGKMDDFLVSIDRPELRSELSKWDEWQKIVPLTFAERPKKVAADIKAYRTKQWPEGGIFADVCNDDYAVKGLVATGPYRLRVPVWGSCDACRDCQICLNSCPENAITRKLQDKGSLQYICDANRCIGCGICEGVCPWSVWGMFPNPEPINMYRNYVKVQ